MSSTVRKAAKARGKSTAAKAAASAKAGKAGGPSTKPIAVYYRVSSDDQSHASQKIIMDRWLEKEGIDPSRVKVYEDVETGRKINRPAFDTMKADVLSGKRTTVAVYAFDRISRDYFDGVKTLSSWLKAGARVVSVTEPLDLSGDLGQALAGVLFALAAIGWKQRRDRQRAGIEVARSKGVYTGRQKGTEVADPLRAWTLAKRGMTRREIGLALGISPRTVTNYLRICRDRLEVPIAS